MRMLTGQDEIVFADRSRGGPHQRLAGLAAAVGGTSPDQLAALTLPEWEERLLAIRVGLQGQRIEAEVRCPDCGAGVALTFLAEDLPREPPLGRDDCGPLSLRDLLLIETEGLQGEVALAALLAASCGVDRDLAATMLAGPDRAGLIAALGARAAGLGLELGTACTDCGAEMVLPFDVAVFLDGEMGARAARLLDEVHLVASSYHWSEAEILALPSDRRQDYLKRILATSAVSALGRL